MSSPINNLQCVNDAFPYPPFPKNEDAIRILTINPGDFHDPLWCTLTAVAFVNKPRYAALSYTWGIPFPDGTLLPTAPGDEESTSTNSLQNAANSPGVVEPTRLPAIKVNDAAMEIQHNLYLAMLHLRSPTHTLALWIDAICINQKDQMEVSSQVSLMSFIYSRAQTVVSWLGPKEFKSHIDMFHHMSYLWKMGQSKHLGAALAQEKTSLMSRDPELEAIARIASSTYWTRLWIVQEVCLARDLIFAYGPDVWTFDSFVNCETLRKLQVASEVELNMPSESYARFRAMLRLLDCRKRRYSLRNSLESLIETFGTQACGKTMDRIYALLGMAYDIHPVSGANYIPDPTEVYLDSINQQQDTSVKQVRGRGVLKVDYSSSLYELWVDVVKFVFFRAKSRQLENKLGRSQALQDQERRISIVRTSGVIQAALDQSVENDMPPNYVVPRLPQIRAIGFLSGKLLHLGPDYSSFVGSFQATQDWFSEWENHYTEHADLQRLHELNDCYTDKIWKYSTKDLERIRDLDSSHVSARRLSAKRQQSASELKRALNSKTIPLLRLNGPRIFLGTGHLIGLAPPAAQTGDVVVQFWNCDAALVMRPDHTENRATEDSIGSSATSFSLVGRADVVDLSDERDTPWTDSWAEDRLCGSCEGKADGSEDSGAVYVELDFATLQAITASIRT
jgi:hypothetical protein